ncbi:MAG: HPr family phosphocarrier protein [Victivallales bacterium]|nr:HPr family phosphocarrier protein [Victivallales bacterium]MCF7889090.1 HPr family phosphocarrier protein [Victivallales bacterium]
MAEKTVKVKNEAGIHCRPSSRIMQKVMEYPDCTFLIETTRGSADLSSILSLMSLGLQKGDKVTVKVEGPDNNRICEEIASLFEYEFDFPPRI